MKDLKAADVPQNPGCYALYRGRKRMNVAKADCLHNGVRKNHRGRGSVMTGLAMRRNVAEYLNIASANDIKQRRYQPTQAVVTAVWQWLDGCHIAWLICATKAG